jgi:transcriptional regulator with XRE-family HTH domain
MTQGVSLSRKDPEFFVALGARIAALRKEAGMTQVQLAELLQCSQQHLVGYEKGRYRIPANLLLVLAEEFEISLDDLCGAHRKSGKPGPASRIERQLQQLSKLPRSQQRLVSEMLDGLLKRAS